MRISILTKHLVVSRLVIIGVLILGLSMIMYVTSPYGALASPDSAGYLAGAHSLINDYTYRNYDGDYLTTWPPLYPLLLAITGIITPLTTSGSPRILGLLSYIFLILTFCHWMTKHQETYWGFAFGTLLIGTSSSVLFTMSAIWSEGPFLVLIVLVLSLCTTTHYSKNTCYLIAALIGAASMIRYVGVLLYPVFILWLYHTRRDGSLRNTSDYLHSIISMVLSVVPLAVFLLRNISLSTHYGGPLTPSNRSFGQSMLSGLDRMSEYILPASLPLVMRGIAAVFLFVSAILLSYRYTSGTNTSLYNMRKYAAIVSSLWALTYLIGVSLMSTRVFVSEDFRIHLPLLPSILCCLLIVSEITYKSCCPSRWLRIAIVIAAGCLAGLSITRASGYLRHRDGWFYSTSRLHTDQMLLLLRDGEYLESDIYSNAADYLYISTGRKFILWPSHVGELKYSVLSNELILLWHTNWWRKTIHPEEPALNISWDHTHKIGDWIVYQKRY